MRFLLLAFVFVFVTGCNHAAAPKVNEPAPEPQPPTEKPAAEKIAESKPAIETMPSPEALQAIQKQAAAKPADGTATVLLLADLKLVADTEQNPEGFFFRGVMKNGIFIPDDKGLQGNAAIPIGGTPGWVELHTAKFLPAMTARAPAQPFIEGRMTPAGFFPNQPKLKTE